MLLAAEGGSPAVAGSPAEAGSRAAAGSSAEAQSSVAAAVAGLPAVEDAYKLLHQAHRGPGHAISSPEAAAAWLREEWVSMGETRPGEVLFESLLESAPFVRVHLRPYRDLGGTPDSMLAAFLRSAEEPADSLAFQQAWTELRRAIVEGMTPFTLSAYDTLDTQARAHGYPPIHHSEAFTQSRAPVYRVLARAEAKRLLRGLPDQGHRH
jgi:hypothetical protein